MGEPSPLDLYFKKGTDHPGPAKWKKPQKPVWLQSKWWSWLPRVLRAAQAMCIRQWRGKHSTEKKYFQCDPLWGQVSSHLLILIKKGTKIHRIFLRSNRYTYYMEQNKHSVKSVIHLKNSFKGLWNKWTCAKFIGESQVKWTELFPGFQDLVILKGSCMHITLIWDNIITSYLIN